LADPTEGLLYEELCLEEISYLNTKKKKIQTYKTTQNSKLQMHGGSYLFAEFIDVLRRKAEVASK
jgi:hypothetical protein